MKKVILGLIALAITACAAAAKNQTESNSPRFKDPRDGKTYRTVEIGTQVWMAQDLDYHGEDGYLGLCFWDKPEIKRLHPDNCKDFGRLYNFEEAKSACPEGWRLPFIDEWETLIDFAGGEEVAGKKLKAKKGWATFDFQMGREVRDCNSPFYGNKCKWTEEKIDDRGRRTVIEIDKCATDEFGFGALSSGNVYSYDSRTGVRKNTGLHGVGKWWSTSGITVKMSCASLKVEKERGCDNCKVRCIKDDQ